MRYYSKSEITRTYVLAVVAIVLFTVTYGLCIAANDYGNKHFPMSRFTKS